MIEIAEKMSLKGKVEVFVAKGRPEIRPGALHPLIKQLPGFPKVYKSCSIDFKKSPIIDHFKLENIILNYGKDDVIKSLTTGVIQTICRMAVGDRGTIPSDPTVPKVPTPEMTAPYNEVFRSDVDAVVLDVGTPSVHQVKFIKTFSATIIPIGSFSNQASPAINEVMLVSADLIGGDPLPRADIAAPDPHPTDERGFALRTFKSVPFEAANEITITIRYSIFIA